MLISQYQGVIKIPMFWSGQVFNFAGYPPAFANFNFNLISPEPNLDSAAYTPSQFTLGQMQDEIMGVFGLSKLELNPTGGNVMNTSGVSDIDGYSVFYGLQGATLDPTVYYSTIGMKKHPRATGTYSTAGIFLTNFQGTRMSTLYQPLPMSKNFLPVIGGLYTNLAFDLYPITIAAPSGAVTFEAGSITDGTGNTVTNLLSGANILTARITNQPFLDNGLYVSCTGGIHAHGAKYARWGSFAMGVVNVDDLSLDNAALNAIFQNPIANNQISYGYYKGYIHVLKTNGAGPTGQLMEVVLMSPDFSKYWLLQFLPQDAQTAAALIAAPGTMWKVKIDSDGIVWFNSSNAVDVNTVYYSYSPIPYFIPVPYIGNLQPFELPCFNVCSPVTQIP